MGRFSFPVSLPNPLIGRVWYSNNQMPAERARSLSVDEVVEKVLAVDNETSSIRHYWLRTKRDSSQERPDFQFVSVNLNNPEDKIGVFLKAQEELLTSYVNNPDTIRIPRKDVHGRTRSKREQRDVRDSRLREYKFELAVIRGYLIMPITLIESVKIDNDGNPNMNFTGYAISREWLKG